MKVNSTMERPGRNREDETRWRMSKAPDPATMIRNVAAEFPDRDAFIHLRTADDAAPRSFSYVQAADIVARFGAALQDAGIQPGDGVAIIGPSIPETLFALAGAASVAVALPLNPLLSAAAIASQFRLGRVKAIVALGHHPAIKLDVLAAQAAELSGAVELVVEIEVGFGRSPALAGRGWNCISWEDFTGAVTAGSLSCLTGDRAAALFHTGGTTGAPKLAELGLSGLMASLHSSAVGLGWTGQDRVLQLLPFFHVGGALVSGLSLFSSGATLINAGIAGARDPNVIAELWPIASRMNATIVGLVPPSWSQVAVQTGPLPPLPGLRMLLTGATAIAPDLARRMGRIAGVPMAQCLGMTELSGSCSNQPLDGVEREPAAGFPMPLVETRLRPIAEQGPSELLARGPMMFRGYRTDAGMHLDLEDGWYATGDLAELLPDGQMKIVGRAKDVIIRSGHNIDPASIEDVVSSHPAVVMAAAVGMPDEFAGELPVVFVVRNPASEITADELLAFVGDNVEEPPARPKRLYFVDALPLTPVGKVARYRLRQQAAVTRAAEILAGLSDDISSIECADVAARRLVLSWTKPGDDYRLTEANSLLAPLGLTAKSRALQ